MWIELTAEQADLVAAAGETPIVVDPRTQQRYRLVREEVDRNAESPPYDDSPWTPGEMAGLAGAAFGQMDDTDYSEYVREPS